jgi:hypothetical protein
MFADERIERFAFRRIVGVAMKYRPQLKSGTNCKFCCQDLSRITPGRTVLSGFGGRQPISEDLAFREIS